MDSATLWLQLADAYAVSILANRVQQVKAAATFPISALLSAAGLVQLAVSTAALSFDPRMSPSWWFAQGPFWLAAASVMVGSSLPLMKGYAIGRHESGETAYLEARTTGSRGRDSGGKAG